MKILLIIVIFIIILLVTGMLGAKNDQLIVFDYLLNTIEMRLSMLLVAFFSVGVALSTLVFSLVWMRLKWRIGSLERQTKNFTKIDS